VIEHLRREDVERRERELWEVATPFPEQRSRLVRKSSGERTKTTN
jgi:hypothetical protein